MLVRHPAWPDDRKPMEIVKSALSDYEANGFTEVKEPAAKGGSAAKETDPNQKGA